MSSKKEQIKDYLLQHICDKDKEYVKKAMEAFSTSKSSVYTYLKELVDDNIIQKTKGGDFSYSPVFKTTVLSYKRDKIRDETTVFEYDITPLLKVCSANSIHLWNYVFCEMMNNAIEHSSAEDITITVQQNRLYTAISISDNGIGIFENIKQYIFNTTGEDIPLNEAASLLLAGKFTTAKTAHSGEGIFFSSHIMDEFAIMSSGLHFTRTVFRDDFTEHIKGDKGTTVYMQLANDSLKSLTAVFNRFSDPDEGFYRTDIPIAHLFPGLFPVARSQARRLGAMIEEFKETELDFTDIDEIGQGFAHELFIVWQKAHPDISLKVLNASDNVRFMINHVIKTDTNRKDN